MLQYWSLPGRPDGLVRYARVMRKASLSAWRATAAAEPSVAESPRAVIAEERRNCIAIA